MRQLNEHDASFLYSDTLHANSNITFVQIYDQSTAPGGKVRFKSILAHIEGRLHRSPIFRSKLLRVPLEIDYPYWIEDEHFDLEYHVRHIALPEPGDWRQFCIQASRIHARALDLNRPLWEIYVIEGLDSIVDLPPGSFALLTKIHHAAVDVESHNEIIDVLHDTRRRPVRPEPAEPWFPERPPPAISLLLTGAFRLMLSPLRLIGPLIRFAPAARAFARDVLRPEYPANATRFNSVVSSHRVFDTRRFALDEFESIRRLVPGASLDDAVLAVCAGGLRRYLGRHGELPEVDLTALLTAVGAPRQRVGLGTTVADPLQRLALIRSRAASAESPAQNGVAQVLDSCTITRLPGPATPLYLGGARLTYFSAILPISDGIGLTFAVTRYDGRVVVSPTSCRELMPDPQAFTQCVRDSFQEYLALARPVGAARAAPKAARSAAPRGSASGRRSQEVPPARTG
ncbi:MAG: wax ester/triacylglycerol synthase domain-containing protein, partial [Caldimonas sp.]